MTRFARAASRSLFSAGVFAALGFGAVQATPASASPQSKALACTKSVCNDYCINTLGYDYGKCANGECVCMLCTHASGDIC
jgi:hypothetical protein